MKQVFGIAWRATSTYYHLSIEPRMFSESQQDEISPAVEMLHKRVVKRISILSFFTSRLLGILHWVLGRILTFMEDGVVTGYRSIPHVHDSLVHEEHLSILNIATADWSMLINPK